jgi:TIR domain
MMLEPITFKHDVFISYSPQDRQWVNTVLLDRLNRAQISYIDEYRFEPGKLKVAAIDDAIISSRRVLLVISAAYLADTSTEFIGAGVFANMLSKNKDQRLARVIPVFKEEVDTELPLRIQSIVAVELYTGEESEWGRLIAALSSAPPAPQPCPPPTVQPEVEQHYIRDVLYMLSDLINKPEVAGPLNEFREPLETMHRQINNLNEHKVLHDKFHDLEGLFLTSAVFVRDVTASAEIEWEQLDDFSDQINDKVDEIGAQAISIQYAANDALWLVKLEKAAREHKESVALRNVTQLMSARRRIGEVLNQQPAKVNAKLVEFARVVRLTLLGEVLNRIHESLRSSPDNGGLTPLRLQKIKASAKQVDEIDLILHTALFTHDALQQMDEELRRVEASVESDVEQVIEAWQYLSPKLQAICATKTADSVEWEKPLSTSATELENALRRGEIRREFRGIRREVPKAFNRVDKNLLAKCKELEEEIGKPLDSLLDRINKR